MVVFCNLTKPKKFMANKKYPKNETILLGGYCLVILLGDESQTQGLSCLSVAMTEGFVLGLVWNSSKDNLGDWAKMPDVVAMCTAALCALTHNSCLPMTGQYVLLNSYMICFLITCKLFHYHFRF